MKIHVKDWPAKAIFGFGTGLHGLLGAFVGFAALLLGPHSKLDDLSKNSSFTKGMDAAGPVIGRPVGSA
jgi:hypothetical protein